MTREPDTDNDIPFERKPLLRLQELLLEARAAAEGDDWVFADHSRINSFVYAE